MKHTNVEYKVIEDKRIVVATIRGITYDPINVFNKKFMAHSTSDLVIDNNYNYNQKFLMPYQMKAVARCVPDDEFSVEKGKQIALKKLSEKYNCSLDRHLTHIAKAMQKSMNKMNVYLKDHKMV
jgi:hypothetical protein